MKRTAISRSSANRAVPFCLFIAGNHEDRQNCVILKREALKNHLLKDTAMFTKVTFSDIIEVGRTAFPDSLEMPSLRLV